MSTRRRNNGNGHSKRNGRRSGANGAPDRQLELSTDEARVLLDACRMFRHSLPVYLMSSKPDLVLIKRVMRKLS